MTRVKIAFRLEQDDDGYPPFDIETVWAVETATSGHYQIDNIPFFARQATIGDVVRVQRRDQELVFDAVVSRSASSLIRVIAYDATHIPEIRAALATLGCSTEAFASRSIIAVDVPQQASLRDVQRYLADLEQRDIATYEEPILRHPSDGA